MGSQYTLSSVPYRPSTPLTGGESPCIYRGQNMILRGMGGNTFYEAYAGSENLNEIVPHTAITGTLDFSPSSKTVTGTTTAFLDELHPNQMILANGEPLVVSRLISQTSFIANRLPTTTGAGATAYRLPVLFDLDITRGSLLHGNGVKFDRGTIMAVGDGDLYVNGTALSATFAAQRTPQVALYDSATMTYTVVDVGFSTTPAITYSNVAVVNSGGVKNMALGYYSLRVGYYSEDTGGYSNPTATLLASGTTGFQITVANSTFTIDTTGDVATRPANATGYIVYGSAFSGSSTISQVNAIEGGWFQVYKIPFTSLVANVMTFEYIDSDLGNLVSFDNDTPPDAEWIVNLTGYAVLVSTDGEGVNSGSRTKQTSPGPFISPMKGNNLDAYPATLKVPTEKGEVIIGTVSAAGRIFVLTSNTLQAVTPTGLPSAPFTCRPFWRRGFQGTFNLAFVDDTLYGFTTAGMFRSIATGDEGAESHIFASDVETQTADWHGGYVFVAHDPKNEHICFIYSGARTNEAGYWETDILAYSLRQQVWMPTIVLSDPNRDMIVSGVATVAGHLEFIAGGRRGAPYNDVQCDTWRYDTGSSVDVPYYLAWNFMDGGVEMTAKTVRKLRPKGKFTAPTVKLYLTTPDTLVDVADLELGANSTYSYSPASSPSVKQYGVQKCRARNGMMLTARIEGTANWDGNPDTEKDQFHELAVEMDIFGTLR